MIALPSIAARLADATDSLDRAGIAFARREATRTYAAVAGLKPGDVWLARERPVPPTVGARFDRALAARLGGLPFAYAVGRAAFRTLELASDARALIPRPETEGLIDLVLGRGRGDPKGLADARGGRGRGGIGADLGTGTGCLALALAVEGPFERVIAVERDPAAAALARENIAAVASRVPVDLREGDWLGPLRGETCSAIVSNPPYLTPQEWDELDPLVKLHEPRAALVSGADGLEATHAILAGAAACLAPGGVLALEIDERRPAAVLELARAAGWRRVTIHDDVFGRPRYAMAYRKETL